MSEYHRLPIEDTLSGQAIAALITALEHYSGMSPTESVECELENLRNLCRSYLDHKADGVWQETAPEAIDDLLT